MVATKKISVFFRIDREFTDGTRGTEEVEIQDVKISLLEDSRSQKISVEGIIVSKREGKRAWER